MKRRSAKTVKCGGIVRIVANGNNSLVWKISSNWKIPWKLSRKVLRFHSRHRYEGTPVRANNQESQTFPADRQSLAEGAWPLLLWSEAEKQKETSMLHQTCQLLQLITTEFDIKHINQNLRKGYCLFIMKSLVHQYCLFKMKSLVHQKWTAKTFRWQIFWDVLCEKQSATTHGFQPISD